MTTSANWLRCKKDRLCPICNHPDWCLIAPDGNAAICGRIESTKRCGESGWLHKLRDDRTPRHRSPIRVPVAKPSAAIDFGTISRQFQEEVKSDLLQALADDLVLTVESLSRLGIGWAANCGAWSFPMSDATEHVVGIRLRFPNGRKLCIKGSRLGLFIPDALTGNDLLVTEGESDCAAMLDLGFNAIGRPGCGNGTSMIVDLVKARTPRQVVVVADADAPGQRDAEALASTLRLYVPDVRVVTPPAPHKDGRAWKIAGATHAHIQQAIDAAKPRKLNVKVKS